MPGTSQSCIHSFIKFKRCNPAAAKFRHWGLVELQTSTIGSKLLRISQFSSALTAEDHSNSPSMDGDTFTEIYFFSILCPNWINVKLLAQTVFHPRSWNSLRRNHSGTNIYPLGLPAAWWSPTRMEVSIRRELGDKNRKNKIFGYILL